MRTPFLFLIAPLFVLACGGDDTSTPVDASTDSPKTDATASDASPDGSSGDGAAACASPATCVAVSACAQGQGHLTPGACGSASTACCSPESACPAEDFLCCDGSGQFRPSCVNGALVCTSPLTRCASTDGGSDAPSDG